MDHDYLNVHNVDSPGGLYLHGGGQGAGGPSDLVGPTDGGQCYYRYANGRFFNGLVAVALELESVHPGDGGFACVAGSHKANIELPRDWKTPVPKGGSNKDIPPCVHQVAAEAGDAIIFTGECLRCLHTQVLCGVTLLIVSSCCVCLLHHRSGRPWNNPLGGSS